MITRQVPRVRFNDAPPTVHDPQPRLIVASPRKHIVEPQPKPILKPSKYIDESIVVRVQAQCLQLKTTINESIAEQVQFDNIVLTKCRNSPYPYTNPKYCVKQQFAEYDTSAPVGKDKQMHVQQVTGKFNWYARGVNGTLLMPISASTSQTDASNDMTTSSTIPRLHRDTGACSHNLPCEQYDPCHS